MAYDGQEVEIKLQITPPEAFKVRQLLVGRGASAVHHIDTYFDTPDGAFSTKEPIEEWLSCRQRGGRTHLNHKKFTYGADGIAMDCAEVDVTVSSPEGAAGLLQALGFRELVTVSKERLEALVDDVLVALDKVDNLGQFVELEATQPHGDYRKTREYLFEVASSLGISQGRIDNRGYPYQLVRRSAD